MENTRRGKGPLNETPVCTKSMNMDIWVVGTLNQLFVTDSYTEKKKFPKRSKAVTGKTAFIVIGPLCAPHSFCLNNGF